MRLYIYIIIILITSPTYSDDAIDKLLSLSNSHEKHMTRSKEMFELMQSRIMPMSKEGEKEYIVTMETNKKINNLLLSYQSWPKTKAILKKAYRTVYTDKEILFLIKSKSEDAKYLVKNYTSQEVTSILKKDEKLKLLTKQLINDYMKGFNQKYQEILKKYNEAFIEYINTKREQKKANATEIIQ